MNITDEQMQALRSRAVEVQLSANELKNKDRESLRELFGEKKWNEKVEESAKELYSECLKTMKLIEEIYGA